VPDTGQTSELARAVQEVTERASLIIREEIELAKAEVTTKVTKLAKGAAVGAAAGVFVLAGLIYALHALAWGIWRVVFKGQAYWAGFAVVAGLLFLLAIVAGLLAYRFVRGGAPPTPTLAIEEAQRVRETVQAAQRAELHR
jgi:hypothetical protein